MDVLREGLWFAGWWWRLEARKGQSSATAGLFLGAVLLVGGIFRQREDPTEAFLRFLFWISYFFGLFLALPRAFLERRPEEWRWLYSLVSEAGALLGLWVYSVSLGIGLGMILWVGAQFWWGSTPPLNAVLLGGVALSLPLLIAAFLTARAETSYALAAVLAFPLSFFPLLWLVAQSQPPSAPLLGIVSVETLLFFLLGPYVWRN